MSTWKLPRKAKKAWVRKYGREAYRAMRMLASGPRFEGFLEVKDRQRGELAIAADFAHDGPRVAVLFEKLGGITRVLHEVKLHTQATPKFPVGGAIAPNRSLAMQVL